MTYLMGVASGIICVFNYIHGDKITAGMFIIASSIFFLAGNVFYRDRTVVTKEIDALDSSIIIKEKGEN